MTYQQPPSIFGLWRIVPVSWYYNHIFASNKLRCILWRASCVHKQIFLHFVFISPVNLAINTKMCISEYHVKLSRIDICLPHIELLLSSERYWFVIPVWATRKNSCRFPLFLSMFSNIIIFGYLLFYKKI